MNKNLNTYIDLFSGVGGLSLGFNKFGFNNIFSNEYDKSISNSYHKNFPKHKLFTDNIIDLDFKSIKNSLGIDDNSVDVIIGGPPCQGFSMANRKRIENDERNLLFLNFGRAVKEFKPKCFLIENVMGMSSESINIDNDQALVVNSLRSFFNDIGYEINFTQFKSEEHGVPQIRRRMMVIGTRLNNKINDLKEKKIGFLEKQFLSKEKLLKKNVDQLSIFNEKTMDLPNPVTVWDAISDLPQIEFVEKSQKQNYISQPKNKIQKEFRKDSKFVFNHIPTPHDNKAIERIKLIKQGENFLNLPSHLRTKSVHSGAYGRLEAKGLSPTITTRFDTPSTGRVIHPYLNRCLTVREAARIQSFPDNFIFYGTRTSQGKQVGNAVPPNVAYQIAKMFKNQFLK